MKLDLEYGTAAYWAAVTAGQISWEEAEAEQLRRGPQLDDQADAGGRSGALAQLVAGIKIRRPRRRKSPSLGPRLTPAARDLLLALMHLADQARFSAAKVELAARIGVHPDTVRRGLRQLEAEDLVITTHRPGPRPDLDRPSIFTITPAGWAYLNRRPPATMATTVDVADLAAGSSSSTAKLRHPTGLRKKNSVQEPASRPAIRSAPGRAASGPGAHTEMNPNTAGMAGPAEEHPDKKIFRQDGGAVFPVARSAATEDALPTGPESAGGAAQNPELEKIGFSAALALLPAGAALSGPCDWRRIIDRERSIRLSKFHPAAWLRAIAAHGQDMALLAVAVALLRPASASGRPISSRAAYLGGLLRRNNPDLDPIRSLKPLLEQAHN